MTGSATFAKLPQMQIPVEQSCFWLATRNADRHTVSLKGAQKADVTIIGAGFTGLWTAFFLRQLDANLNIAVVEQGCTGYGGSGRNAGMISACIDHSHALAMKHFGAAEAARLAQIGLANIDELSAFAQDCDLERSGHLHVALNDDQVEECRRLVDTADKLNLPGYKFLPAQETRDELNSPLYAGSAYAPGGGIVNPLKLIDKIHTHLLETGVHIYERSKVISVEKNCVRTEAGLLATEKIVLATDSYSHHLFPGLLHYFVPLYDYVLVSQPLTDNELNTIGWSNRQGITDGRNFFNYYRLTADNRVLWGTSEAMYYKGNKVEASCDHSPAHYTALKQSFVRHFPQLSHLSFPFAWGGPIASTTRLTPFFGTLNSGSVYYALGYTGHGIGTTRLAGKILAHMVTAKHSELLDLQMARKKPLPYPPEPLRQIAVNLVTRSLKRVDDGTKPDLLLHLLDLAGIGFSS